MKMSLKLPLPPIRVVSDQLMPHHSMNGDTTLNTSATMFSHLGFLVLNGNPVY